MASHGEFERSVKVRMLSGEEVALSMHDPVRAGLVKYCLQQKTGIPKTEMSLVLGLRELSDHERVPARFAASESLTLVRATGRLPEFLEAQGLRSVNSLGPAGASALHLAAARRRAGVCLEILACEDFRRLNSLDFLDSTALHLATEQRLLGVCSALLLRPDFTMVNMPNRNGRTALHIAASVGDAKTCAGILARPDFDRAVLRARDAVGYTAVELADFAGHKAVVALLREAAEAAASGADVPS
eukprot:TRINITY_DN3255_c0_g2_i1.p1 TRINITY_DN3255_c0_g2~~TRINITY_DN3255_c0_g2_i1.p1  ORF type:complete len:244 (-),score=52.27 TRINITY_DN3255_c0_g2_i1:5-736(-)